MQATAAHAQASKSALARDLFAFLGYLLRSTTPDMFRALGELDLSLTQVKLLHALDDPERELSLKDLAECLALSLPAASRAIDALHQRGYVHRREDEHDRRMKRVRITAAGTRALRKLNQTRLAQLEEFAATMSPAERRRLVAALAPLLERPEIAAMRPAGKGAR
ncbi:MAG: MarR family transcriptional regulator [Actinomycetota bacterium]|nr:MarR family transcriptional regulator [Actinomycetota bacterium]